MVCLPIFSAIIIAVSASLSPPSNFLFVVSMGGIKHKNWGRWKLRFLLPPFWLLKWEKRFLNPDEGVHAKLMHARYF